MQTTFGVLFRSLGASLLLLLLLAALVVYIRASLLPRLPNADTIRGDSAQFPTRKGNCAEFILLESHRVHLLESHRVHLLEAH